MRLKNIMVGIFFGLLLVVGIGVSNDYGIPWDESLQRKLGNDTYDYVVGNSEKLLKNKDRYYGPILEFTHIYIEKALGLVDVQKIYQTRHLTNYFLFALGAFFFFLLLRKRFRSVWWALLGTLMLIVSPRIFAHSFYNAKDIGFMSMFIIAAYLGILFVDKKKPIFAVFAALSTALLIDIRIMGILLPVLLIDVFFFNGYRKRDRKSIFLYVGLVVGLVILFWPALWKEPLTNFLAALDQMANYPQKTSILYFGERLKSTAVTWHYTLGWILVTSPISYMALAIFGFWFLLDSIPKVNREDLVMLGWLILPLAATIIFKSTLYDAWRQMFFIYPPILYFAVYALVKALPRMRRIFLVLLIINMYFVISFMVDNHPYQNLYLNEFIKPPYEEKFELDYWGLAYKEGIEYIAANDSSTNIKIAVENLPGENNLMMLDKKDRDRFEIVSGAHLADYYLTNYRKYKDLYYTPAYYTVEVQGTRILGVHRQ
jgi:drug/metabolite transporter superfamily protein YnfA